jgi:hypothetical protein
LWRNWLQFYALFVIFLLVFVLPVVATWRVLVVEWGEILRKPIGVSGHTAVVHGSRMHPGEIGI